MMDPNRNRPIALRALVIVRLLIGQNGRAVGDFDWPVWRHVRARGA